MRVALITFCASGDEKAVRTIKALESGSVSRGNQVDVLNGLEELQGMRLTMYDYIAAVAKPFGPFNGKVAPRVAEFLASSGTVSGKKGCAIVLNSGLFSQKACRALMRALEGEGVVLDYFEVVRDEDHARAVGTKIG